MSIHRQLPNQAPPPEAGMAGLVDKKAAPVQLKQLELPIPCYHPSDLRGQGEMVVYQKAQKV